MKKLKDSIKVRLELADLCFDTCEALEKIEKGIGLDDIRPRHLKSRIDALRRTLEFEMGRMTAICDSLQERIEKENN